MLEDEDGICGYALGTVDVTPFIKKCKIAWIPFMQEKYSKPSSDKELSEAEVSTAAICFGSQKLYMSGLLRLLERVDLICPKPFQYQCFRHMVWCTGQGTSFVFMLL